MSEELKSESYFDERAIGSSALLEDLPEAAVTLSADGDIWQLNAIARELLVNHLGLELPLATTTTGLDLRLYLRVVMATRQPLAVDMGMVLGRAAELHMIPWRCGGAGSGELTAVVLSVRFEESEGGFVQAAAQQWALSPAEAGILALIRQGYCVKQIARHRGSAVNTVRSQVKSILAKAGAGSQRELLSRLRPRAASYAVVRSPRKQDEE
jgi:DNA-binding CsgD family transcriptional regulator